MEFAIQPTFLFPLWNYDRNGKGIDPAVQPLGFITNQNRMALPTWGYAMEQYRPARIVEIGAYNGGFTCALAVHAYNIGAKVFSFDISEIPDPKYRPLSEFLGVEFFQMDCFSEAGITKIIQLIQQPGVTYLLCDGGNKALEVNTFAPHLKSGDIIGAHDYFVERHDWWGWQEIRKEQVEETLTRHNFTPFFQEYFDFAAWLVYKKH